MVGQRLDKRPELFVSRGEQYRLSRGNCPNIEYIGSDSISFFRVLLRVCFHYCTAKFQKIPEEPDYIMNTTFRASEFRSSLIIIKCRMFSSAILRLG
jgi:hypothetical protein